MRTLTLLLAFSMTMTAQNMQEPKPAETTAATDAPLETAQSLIGKATFLRCLCADAKQSYDENGKMVGESKKPADWTLAAFNAEKATRKDASHIELTGTRVGIRYNEYAKTFERKPLKLDTMHLEVTANDDAQLKKALDNIFAIGIDYRLQQTTTPMWKRYFLPTLPWPDDALKGKTIYIASPKDPSFTGAYATKKADIELTAEAQQNRITGSIILKAIVDTDGTAHHITLVRPLGFGLDEKAVEAVSKWQFKPAMKDGQPVITELAIEERITARPTK